MITLDVDSKNDSRKEGGNPRLSRVDRSRNERRWIIVRFETSSEGTIETKKNNVVDAFATRTARLLKKKKKKKNALRYITEQQITRDRTENEMLKILKGTPI